MAETRSLRSAVYVDFDNIFSGLEKLDLGLAQQFARNPGRLVAWLEAGSEDWEGAFQRRFLAKVCYLNPMAFGRFRSFFTSAGFRVIDTPSLTQQGKSAADIHLVLDVMEALSAHPRIDEYVICSADADFTPLMAKIRVCDKRAVMIAASTSSLAYQAVCDEVVTPAQLLDAFAPEAPWPSVPQAAPEDGEGTTGVPQSPVALTDDGTEAGTPDATGGPLESDVDLASLAIVDAVRQAGGILGGAAAAGAGKAAAPSLAARRWGGAGFREFLASHVHPLVFISTGSGGMVVDPDLVPVDQAQAEDDSLESQVARVTKIPRFDAATYAHLFEEIARFSEHPPPLSRFAAEIRDAAAGAGFSIARKGANTVILGLVYSGVDPREGAQPPDVFARAWRDHVMNLCARAGLEISDPEGEELSRWLTGAAR